MPHWVIWVLGLIVVGVVVLWLLRGARSRRQSDDQAIDRLIQAGTDMTRVHEVEFRFYFPSRASAEEAAGRLRADGYKVSIAGTAPDAPYAVTALCSMVPLLSEMQALRVKFDELATRAGGLYETWTAEVVR